MEEDEELDMEVITECMNGELIYDQVESYVFFYFFLSQLCS